MYSSHGVDPLIEQIYLLRNLFGVCSVNWNLYKAIGNGKVEMPKNASEWIAVPNYLKNPEIFGRTYQSAFQIVLRNLKAEGLDDYCHIKLNRRYFRQSACKELLFQYAAQRQDNPEILILAAQFGKLYEGRSTREACENMHVGEFGLGAFEVGCRILTGLEFSGEINCLGDELDDPEVLLWFDHTPFFKIKNNGSVEFGAWPANACRPSSASGFLPYF